jgi:hypothetical protein
VTDDDLQDVRDWLSGEEGSNRYLNARGQLSGSELAVEHVKRLLAEVERLRGGVAGVRAPAALRSGRLTSYGVHAGRPFPVRVPAVVLEFDTQEQLSDALDALTAPGD